MFGKNIKFLRKNKNLSQEWIAEKLEYKSFTTIQKWEDETSEPPLNKFKVLSDMFNVSMDQLYNEDLTINNTINNKKEKKLIYTYRKLDEEKQDRVSDFANYQLDEMNKEKEDNIIKLNKTYEPLTVAAHSTSEKLEKEDIDAIDEAIKFVKDLNKENE